MKMLLIVLATLTPLVISADDAAFSKDVETITPKERPLYIRNIPGIIGYSSSVYEIPIHPYRFVSILLGIRQAAVSIIRNLTDQCQSGFTVGIVHFLSLHR
jgi:hypothetical protein